MILLLLLYISVSMHDGTLLRNRKKLHLINIHLLYHILYFVLFGIGHYYYLWKSPWLPTNRWFSPDFSTNKTGCHDIAEILLKVTLATISQPHECLVYSFNTYLFISFILFYFLHRLFCGLCLVRFPLADDKLLNF